MLSGESEYDVDIEENGLAFFVIHQQGGVTFILFYLDVLAQVEVPETVDLESLGKADSNIALGHLMYVLLFEIVEY